MRIAGPVLLFLLTLFWGSAASADHMTGTYQGTGDVAGVTLELRQTGNALQGTITGSDQGTLTGQTDGGVASCNFIKSAGIAFQIISCICQINDVGTCLQHCFGNRVAGVLKRA